MIIYKITNNVNNKVYIGQTIAKKHKDRWNRHIKNAKNKINHPLYNAINKYGLNAFCFEVIDSASSIEELNKKETDYIVFYSATNRKNGYNFQKGGNNRKHHPDSIKKMSKKHKNKLLSDKHKNAISISVKKEMEKDPLKFKKGAIAMQKIFKENLKKGLHPKKVIN